MSYYNLWEMLIWGADCILTDGLHGCLILRDRRGIRLLIEGSGGNDDFHCNFFLKNQYIPSFAFATNWLQELNEVN